MLWEQAVIQYGRFVELHEDSGGYSPGDLQEGVENGSDAIAYLTTQGKLQGIAYTIAKLLNPSKPDIDDVKAQIRAQWESAEEE